MLFRSTKEPIVEVEALDIEVEGPTPEKESTPVNSRLESMGIVEESDNKEDEGTVGLQETYNSLIEKTGEYAKVAKAAIKKMKRVKKDYRSLLVGYKETKCEMETLNGADQSLLKDKVP